MSSVPWSSRKPSQRVRPSAGPMTGSAAIRDLGGRESGSRLSASLRPGRPARFQVRVRADDGSYGALRLARTGTRSPAISTSKRPPPASRVDRGVRRRHIAERHDADRGVAVSRRGDIADRLAVAQDRARRHARAARPPRARRARRSRRASGLRLRGDQRVAADEVAACRASPRSRARPRRACRPASARGPRRDSPSRGASTRSRSSRRRAGRNRRPPPCSASYTVAGEFDRHVELPAELAHVGAARGQHASHSRADLADRARTETPRCRSRRLAHPRQQLARARPHHREHRIGRGHVGQRRVRVLGRCGA